MRIVVDVSIPMLAYAVICEKVTELFLSLCSCSCFCSYFCSYFCPFACPIPVCICNRICTSSPAHIWCTWFSLFGFLFSIFFLLLPCKIGIIVPSMSRKVKMNSWIILPWPILPVSPSPFSSPLLLPQLDNVWGSFGSPRKRNWCP